eukprot:356534-Chlamydomonas_euryale.AAC.6
MTDGVLRCSTACLYAPTVSMPPAGRIIMMSGMARNDARCSTGWWVGPSSPRPIESCVIT